MVRKISIYAVLLLMGVVPVMPAMAAPETADDVISELFVYGSVTGDNSGIKLGYVGDDTGYAALNGSGTSYFSGNNGFTSANRAQHQNEWTVQWPATVLDNGTTLTNGGTIRGIAQCNRIAGSFAVANYNMDDPYTTVTEDGERQCWCKLTGVSAKAGADIAVSGDWMSPRGAAWVFSGTYSSAADCARNCADLCAYYVRYYSAFRSAVFGVGALGMESDSRSCGKNLVNGKLYDYQVPRTVNLDQGKYTVSVAAADTGTKWMLRLRNPANPNVAAPAATAAAALAEASTTWTVPNGSAELDKAAAAGWVFGPAENSARFAITSAYDGWLVDIARMDSTGSQNLVLEMGAVETPTAYAAADVKKCVGKIATKLRADNAFNRVNFARDVAVRAISRIVEKTVTQATNIASIQSNKQTRPNDDYSDSNNAENCPAGKQCLLVEGTDSKPHWYEIFDPVQWFMPAIWSTNANYKNTYENSKWTYYNGFYKGDSAFRKTYIDGSTSTYDRPFASTTRCTNPSYADDTRYASPCYNTMTGAFHTLADGEWAAVYEGNEATGVKPGIIYGTSKCTAVAGPNNAATSNPTKLNQLSASDQAAWAVLPTSSTKDNYKQCWCKMTAIGVNDNGTTVADLTNGGTYSINGAAWVFNYASSSAANCAGRCAYSCASGVRNYSGFRSAVFGVGAN